MPLPIFLKNKKAPFSRGFIFNFRTAYNSFALHLQSPGSVRASAHEFSFFFRDVLNYRLAAQSKFCRCIRFQYQQSACPVLLDDNNSTDADRSTMNNQIHNTDARNRDDNMLFADPQALPDALLLSVQMRLML